MVHSINKTAISLSIQQEPSKLLPQVETPIKSVKRDNMQIWMVMWTVLLQLVSSQRTVMALSLPKLLSLPKFRMQERLCNRSRWNSKCLKFLIDLNLLEFTAQMMAISNKFYITSGLKIQAAWRLLAMTEECQWTIWTWWVTTLNKAKEAIL